MNKILNYVNPFHGNHEVDMVRPEGIAATWFWIKAQTGNTHPGAAMPFNAVTVCSHTGGYPTGYGINEINSHASPNKICDTIKVDGLTHFHVSGTGATRIYYNYFKIMPAPNRVLDSYHKLISERAVPGLYEMQLENGIKTSSTVAAWSAYHKIEFSDDDTKRVFVDCSSTLIHGSDCISKVEGFEMTIANSNVQCKIICNGVPLYAYFYALNAKITKFNDEKRYGFILDFDNEEKNCEIKIGFSLKSYDIAKSNCENIINKSFKEVYEETSDKWDIYLNAIVAHSDSDTNLREFYSCLYRIGIKPCDGYNNNFLFDDEEFFFEFATLWDQYKTQLPFLATFYPSTMQKLVKGYVKTTDRLCDMPNMLMISSDLDGESVQASGLFTLTASDSMYRHIDIDIKNTANILYKALTNGKMADFYKGEKTKLITHTLDLSQAAFSLAMICKKANMNSEYDEMITHSKRWKEVFDEEGMLPKNEKYYEGEYRNYSFRLLHDMKTRINLMGKDNFIKELDDFFGIDAEPVKPIRIIGDEETMKYGVSLHRFQGYNNETDMETPYAYLYCNRHDRLCEISKAGYKYMLHDGSGGLPGNEDSGALTSMFAWMAMGLYPVAGQPVILLGRPELPRFDLRENSIMKAKSIIAHNLCDENIYVEKIIVDSKELFQAWLWMDDFLNAKEIVFYMSKYPSSFDTIAPPSFDEDTIGEYFDIL